MANKCLPSGDMRKPDILGNCANTVSVGTWMLATAGVCATASMLEVAMQVAMYNLGNLAKNIFSFKKKAPAVINRRGFGDNKN